jgi:hypothetical protein
LLRQALAHHGNPRVFFAHLKSNRFSRGRTEAGAFGDGCLKRALREIGDGYIGRNQNMPDVLFR